MRGEKQVTFPFEFKYSDGGIFKTEYGVTVRAPSLDQFAVHTAMVAFAAEADQTNQTVGIKAFATIDPKQLETFFAARRNEGGEEAAPVIAETDKQMADRVIGQFASGLGSDRFPKFMDFVLKTLKNNKRLATVGDGQIPLTDSTMDSIAAEGGMDAINLVIATFAGFFLPEALVVKSPKQNGDDTQTSQPSDRAVH